MAEKIYARVVDGIIVEYPVFETHIHNRAHPFEWYTAVQFDQVPEVPAFHELKEELSVRGDQVIARYTVSALSLDAVLASLHRVVDPLLLAPGATVAPVKIEEIPAATVEQIKKLAEDYIEAKMDAFAQQKGYKDMDRVCGYSGSGNSLFKADAQKANSIRDAVWMASYGYFDKVTRGELPVPRFASDIMQYIPEMTWE